MNTPLLLGILAGSLLMSGFFSMLEAAIISQDRLRLKHLAEAGGKSAAIMRLLLADIDRLLAAILLCNNLANITCAAAATVFAAGFFEDGERAVFFVTLAVTFVILVFCEIAPKVVGVRHALAISLFCARPLRALLAVLRPFIAVANFFAGAFLRLLGLSGGGDIKVAMSVKELRTAVRESSVEASESGDSEIGAHYQMLEKLLQFNEIAVEKIMTPRRDIYGIDLNSPPDAMRRRLMAAPFSKLPVFEGNMDRVKGMVDTMRLLKDLAEGETLSADRLRQKTTPPMFVPAAAAALRQMKRMRRAEVHSAIVVDGTGRASGIVTLANFAAAVIGGQDVRLPARPAERRAGGALVVPGDISLLQLSELFPGRDLPATTATNLNGLILERIGTGVPENPVCVVIGEWRFEITEVGETAVRRVRITRASGGGQ